MIKDKIFIFLVGSRSSSFYINNMSIMNISVTTLRRKSNGFLIICNPTLKIVYNL